MKLSVEMIESIATEYSNKYKNLGIGFSAIDLKIGLAKASEFYENQKCVTCQKNKLPEFDCLLSSSRKNHNINDENFGCSEWEPRT